MKRVHKTLLTAIVFVAVGGAATYAFYGDYIRGEAQKRTDDQSKRLFRFGRIDVVQATLKAKGAPITIVRDADAVWMLTAPVRWRADPPTIVAMIDQMVGIKSEATVTEAATASHLADYGLANPVVSLTVKLKDGSERTLHVGKKHELGRAYFVTDGAKKRIGVAPETFYSAVDRELHAMRSTKILPYEASQINGVKVIKGGEVLLELHRTDRWRVGDKIADESFVQRYLRILTRDLRAEAFPTDTLTDTNKARYGLDQPEVTLEVTSEDGGKTVAHLSREGEDLSPGGPFLTLDGTTTAIAVYEGFRQDVAKPSDKFRDRIVSAFDAAEVRRVDLYFESGAQATLTRTGEGWRIRAPDDAPAKPWKADALVRVLSVLRSARVETETPDPAQLREWMLDPPRRRVVVLGEGDKVLADIRIGKGIDDKLTFITAVGLGRVDAIDDALLLAIPNDAEALTDTGS